jgi:multiple antibiotic resistance protein
MLLEQLDYFITLWVIIDPIAALPIFVSLTGDFDPRARRKMAVLTIVVSFLVLCFFISLGQIIIEAMGVSLRDFQIAGGLILFFFAVNMVVGERRDSPVQPDNSKKGFGLAVYPLAVPTIAGPGAMLTVMMLTDHSRFGVREQLITTATVVVVLVITLVMLLLAEPISRVIGTHGANVLKRIMGMILAAVAVKIVIGGISTWLHLPGGS